jgi:hypothetical protein
MPHKNPFILLSIYINKKDALCPANIERSNVFYRIASGPLLKRRHLGAKSPRHALRPHCRVTLVTLGEAEDKRRKL